MKPFLVSTGNRASGVAVRGTNSARPRPSDGVATPPALSGLRAHPYDDTLYDTFKRSSGATMPSLPEIVPVTDLRQDSASVLIPQRRPVPRELAISKTCVSSTPGS